MSLALRNTNYKFVGSGISHAGVQQVSAKLPSRRQTLQAGHLVRVADGYDHSVNSKMLSPASDGGSSVAVPAGALLPQSGRRCSTLSPILVLTESP
jgi:hypothetical protein